MTRSSSLRLSRALLIAGILLLSLALLLLLLEVTAQKKAPTARAQVLSILYRSMPTPHDAAPDDRIDMTMPAIKVQKDSYCGILQIPRYEVELPLLETWDPGKQALAPGRFTGSLYDGTLVIGASDQAGQMQCADRIEHGELLLITDMTGGRYSYTVKQILIKRHLPAQTLVTRDADLVLFVKNSFSLDYTVILCDFSFKA